MMRAIIHARIIYASFLRLLRQYPIEVHAYGVHPILDDLALSPLSRWPDSIPAPMLF